MAFARNIGSLLRQSISRHTSSNGSTTFPSIFQTLRCMSSSRLFIGGLSYAIDEQALRESFTEFGEITEARVIYDRESGRSRGFGFINFTSDEEATAAIQAMDGKQLSGRIVHVNYATERRVGFGGGGGGYSGGYGSGGGGYSQNDSYGSGGGGYSQNDSYGSGGGGYSQNDSYGNRGDGYSQNDSYGSRGGYSQNDSYGNAGGYSQNTSSGSGVGSYGQNDGYGNSGGYNQNDGYGTGGGYGQNDGLGRSTSGMADGKVGYDDEPSNTVSNMGKGY